MTWQARVSDNVKSLVDIEGVAKELKRLYVANLADGLPLRFAGRKAMVEMLAMLRKKGLQCFEATGLMHKCEALPYSGCGCCAHRKKI